MSVILSYVLSAVAKSVILVYVSLQHVVGVTCLGISHVMLARRRFDVCIIDEASQILLPVALGPLFFANKFIVVGDDQQLPPLVKSVDAK